MIPMNDQQRSELFEEYFKEAGFVQSYESYFLTIKTWGVTASGAAIGVGFSKDLISQNRQLEIFVIALALAVAFWLTEVRFKLMQLAHINRQASLERALQENTYIKSPAILESFGEASLVNRDQKRWRKIMLWPHVMLPHVIFVTLSLIVIVIQIVRMLHR